MTDAGMRSMTSLNIQAYKKLCGKKNFGSVVFATATPGSLTPQAFARCKQNGRELKNALDEIMAHQGTCFGWRNDISRIHARKTCGGIDQGVADG